MNFVVKRIAFQTNAHYPYNYRVEFGQCSPEELLEVRDWTNAQSIPCCFTGFTLYLGDKYVTMFQLRWS